MLRSLGLKNPPSGAVLLRPWDFKDPLAIYGPSLTLVSASGMAFEKQLLLSSGSFIFFAAATSVR